MKKWRKKPNAQKAANGEDPSVPRDRGMSMFIRLRLKLLCSDTIFIFLRVLSAVNILHKDHKKRHWFQASSARLTWINRRRRRTIDCNVDATNVAATAKYRCCLLLALSAGCKWCRGKTAQNTANPCIGESQQHKKNNGWIFSFCLVHISWTIFDPQDVRHLKICYLKNAII